MSTRRSGRSRSQSRSRRDEEEAGSKPAPTPSSAHLAGSESESEFEESQEADERVLERAEELEKIKEQQRETREGLAALRQWFEDQGAAMPWVVVLVVSMIYCAFVLRTKNKQVP